jgi:hypothetical protein
MKDEGGRKKDEGGSMRKIVQRAIVLISSSFLLPPSAVAQAPFAPALSGYEFSFPRDHGTHNEYKTEWWYYTGHLRTASGKRYGFEVTFFRVGVEPPRANVTRWDLQNVMPAHFAITDVARKRFRFYEQVIVRAHLSIKRRHAIVIGFYVLSITQPVKLTTVTLNIFRLRIEQPGVRLNLRFLVF